MSAEVRQPHEGVFQTRQHRVEGLYQLLQLCRRRVIGMRSRSAETGRHLVTSRSGAAAAQPAEQPAEQCAQHQRRPEPAAEGMEEGLVRGDIEQDQQRQRRPPTDMPARPPDAALQSVHPRSRDQRARRLRRLRSGREELRRLVETKPRISLCPTALQLRARARAPVVQAGQQTSARLEFLVQRVAVQLIEVMLAELAEENRPPPARR